MDLDISLDKYEMHHYIHSFITIISESNNHHLDHQTQVITIIAMIIFAFHGI